MQNKKSSEQEIFSVPCRIGIGVMRGHEEGSSPVSDWVWCSHEGPEGRVGRDRETTGWNPLGLDRASRIVHQLSDLVGSLKVSCWALGLCWASEHQRRTVLLH